MDGWKGDFWWWPNAEVLGFVASSRELFWLSLLQQQHLSKTSDLSSQSQIFPFLASSSCIAFGCRCCALQQCFGAFKPECRGVFAKLTRCILASSPVLGQKNLLQTVYLEEMDSIHGQCLFRHYRRKWTATFFDAIVLTLPSEFSFILSSSFADNSNAKKECAMDFSALVRDSEQEGWLEAIAHKEVESALSNNNGLYENVWDAY